ncbi:hypothetical protein PENTCL1PPCAC_12811 [Pristionchus entomophagus]|uniref:C2H2-type domain-containing protein n=1 Tax=Pristionchus entomophagus TaxID=358040 RepID=A0AAV5TF14_9BILA|nr:hypothetical protein PENTCL1PPCAC_12811 [Pristionchus entomophagus]
MRVHGVIVKEVQPNSYNQDGVAYPSHEVKTEDTFESTNSASPQSISLSEIIKTASKYKCELCCKIYASKGDLGRHQKTHFEDEVERKPYQCEECGKRFANSYRLLHHHKIHRDDDLRKLQHECDVCGKTYTRQETLAYHKRTNIGMTGILTVLHLIQSIKKKREKGYRMVNGMR